MKSRTTVNDQDLTTGLMISAALHVFCILFLYFGFPVLFKPLPKPHEPVPLTIVDISQLTNTRVKEPEEQPKPPAPPPQPAAKPQQQSELTSKPQQQVEPPTKPVEAEAEAIEKITPKVKPKPTETPKETKSSSLASVLKNVERLKETSPVKAPPAKAEPQKQQEVKSMAPSLSDRLTISEEDALQRQIQQCWNVPAGARDAQNLIVEVTIAVNPDRTVSRVDVVDKNRLATDPFFRSAAEAAVRALYNPRCTPLELPADKYDQWKVIDFTFDPRDML